MGLKQVSEYLGRRSNSIFSRTQYIEPHHHIQVSIKSRIPLFYRGYSWHILSPVCTATHTHTYVYIFVFVCMCALHTVRIFYHMNFYMIVSTTIKASSTPERYESHCPSLMSAFLSLRYVLLGRLGVGITSYDASEGSHNMKQIYYVWDRKKSCWLHHIYRMGLIRTDRGYRNSSGKINNGEILYSCRILLSNSIMMNHLKSNAGNKWAWWLLWWCQSPGQTAMKPENQ